MVEAVLGLLGTILYPLFSNIFVLLSILQGLFYSFAGIGTVYYGGAGFSGMKDEITGSNPSGGKTDTGLLYYILNSDIVKNILISMIILALFLLIIFTTLAFIKTIYAEKPKSWKDIVSSAVKGLVNFIVLPVCCLLGVWVGNIILQAVNGATSTGGTVFLDRKLFLSCAYNANTYRVNSFEAGSAKSEDAYNTIIATIDAYNDPVLNAMRSQIKQGQNSDYYANVVDQMYATDRIGIHNHITVGIGVTPKHGYYQLWSINYLLLIVGGVFMLYVMINVTYGMIKRLFILMMLFVVSPALCAMYPLDDGNAVKSWTGDVKKNILSAYGAVAGMNLLFSFLPIIQNINIASSMFGAWASNVLFLSDIIQLILMVCALFCMNDFISMISGYIGAGNAFSDGKSLRGSATGALKKYGKATVDKSIKTFGAFSRSNAARKEARENGAGFFKSFGAGLGHLGKEGTAGLFNITNKAAGDALGLKTKEVKADDLFKKGSLQKTWESTGLGVAIGDYKKGQKDAAYEAEQKKLKKGYEEGFKKSGKSLVADGAGNLLEGTADLDDKGTMINFNSSLLTELDKAENAGLTQEEFVKLVHEQTGVGEDDMRERIKADKKQKAKAEENTANIEKYEMERKYGTGGTGETATAGLNDETIDKLKQMLIPLFNGQSNTGTGATVPGVTTPPTDEVHHGGSDAIKLDEESINSLRGLANSVVNEMQRLKNSLEDSTDKTDTLKRQQEEIKEKLVSLQRSLETVANAQVGSGKNEDIDQVLALLRQILDNLK